MFAMIASKGKINMNLFIRHFPDDLHKNLKIKAAKEGVRLYELVISMLREILHGTKKK
jgi:plasmid stability protein